MANLHYPFVFFYKLAALKVMTPEVMALQVMTVWVFVATPLTTGLYGFSWACLVHYYWC